MPRDINEVVIMRKSKDAIFPEYCLLNGVKVTARSIRWKQSADDTPTIEMSLYGDFEPKSPSALWFNGKLLADTITMHLEYSSSYGLTIDVEMIGYVTTRIITPESCAKCNGTADCGNCLDEVLSE